MYQSTSDNNQLAYQTLFDFTRTYPVGQGQILVVDGWVYHQQYVIQRLEMLLGNRAYPARNEGEARPDVLGKQIFVDSQAHSLFSGFRAFIPVTPIDKPETHILTLRAHLANGSYIDQPLGEVMLTPSQHSLSKPEPIWQNDEQRVVICIATYKPTPDVFREQIDTLKAQTHTNWICIINDDHTPHYIFSQMEEIIGDDPRFFLYRASERLGFYRNFEQAIARVPNSAEFVALCDQDDKWYPDKISASLEAFTPNAHLVYCDMRIVKSDGEIVAETYWTTRRNNYTDFSSLLLANTVTGAASVFRASLLSDILPFPERLGDSFHDHWIACTAMARGGLGYVDRPLYDYRQHGGNVLGHYTPKAYRPQVLDGIKRAAQAIRSPNRFRNSMRVKLEFDREIYRADVQRISLIAQTLQLRLHGIKANNQRIIDQFTQIDHSLPFLLGEAVRFEVHRRPTVGAEWYCLRGSVGYRLYQQYYRLISRRLRRHAQTVSSQYALGIIGKTGGDVPTFASLQVIEDKIAALRLKINPSAVQRVNLIIPTIDFKVLFGGYIGKFNLALKLKQAGYQVRIVLVDHTQVDYERWRNGFQHYPGLEGVLDQVEIAYHYDRSLSLEVSPTDRFIATTWWTAHIAYAAAQKLGNARFLYLIQEYEPMTFPMNSLYALANETYSFPHMGIFSTELLRDYFRQQRLGVFMESVESGDAYSVSFQNAINPLLVTREMLQHSGKRKLLFYARPEPHAERNLFELGVLSLNRALNDGVFDQGMWEFRGIGAQEPGSLKLSRGNELKLLPRTGLDEYLDLLPSFDIGLSLMLTPHPSLVPLEMASAGLWTVTNTYANKTTDELRSLSTNLLAVPPTISGVVSGLRRAVEQVDDIDARLAGANVRWAHTWDDAFNDAVMKRIITFLNEPS